MSNDAQIVLTNTASTGSTATLVLGGDDSPPITADASLAQASNTLASSATVVVSIDFGASQEVHTLNAEGSVQVQADAALSQEAHSVVAAALVSVEAAFSGSQEHSVVSTATSTVDASVSVSQDSHTLSSVLVVDSGDVVIDAALAQSGQTLIATSVVTVVANANLSQEAHGLSASGTSETAFSVYLAQNGQVVASEAQTTTTFDADLAQDDQISLQPAEAVVSVTQAGDTLTSRLAERDTEEGSNDSESARREGVRRLLWDWPVRDVRKAPVPKNLPVPDSRARAVQTTLRYEPVRLHSGTILAHGGVRIRAITSMTSAKSGVTMGTLSASGSDWRDNEDLTAAIAAFF